MVARRLAAEGVRQAIFYHTSKDDAEALAAEVSGEAIHCDMTSEDQVSQSCQEAADALGGIDFLVHMASGFERVPFDRLDGGAWDRAMGDAKGAYLLSLHAARHMRRNAGPARGHIISFGDWAAGETVYSHYLPYLTAKAAVHYMTRAFAVELAPHGILVNTVAPGPTMRPAFIAPESWERNVVAETPLRHESSPEDMAEMVAALLKMESVTGEVVRVDSGRHLGGPGASASGT